MPQFLSFNVLNRALTNRMRCRRWCAAYCTVRRNVQGRNVTRKQRVMSVMLPISFRCVRSPFSITIPRWSLTKKILHLTLSRQRTAYQHVILYVIFTLITPTNALKEYRRSTRYYMFSNSMWWKEENRSCLVYDCFLKGSRSVGVCVKHKPREFPNFGISTWAGVTNIYFFYNTSSRSCPPCCSR